MSPILDLELYSLRSGGATVAPNHNVSELKRENSKDGHVADSLDERLQFTQTLGL